MDKRFAHQGFRVVNVEPDYEYRKVVEVITTNNVAETYYELISELNKLRKGRGTVCVFINSIATIDSICYRDSAWGNDTATFCSREGFGKLIYKKDRNFYDTVEAEHIKRYNFFTSRFYSAVDIDLRNKPDMQVSSGEKEMWLFATEYINCSKLGRSMSMEKWRSGEGAEKSVWENDLSTNRFLLINDLRRYFKITPRNVRGKRFYRLDSKR